MSSVGKLRKFEPASTRDDIRSTDRHAATQRLSRFPADAKKTRDRRDLSCDRRLVAMCVLHGSKAGASSPPLTALILTLH